MRVPNITLYDTSRYQLGKLTSRLKDANEVVSSEKQINSMSDDPVGLTQVVALKTSVKNLEQIERNVQMGKTWLTCSEDALDSINTLILNARAEASRLVNASATADERKDAVQRIDNILEQIVSLGNTKVGGSYIFSGTDSDTQPFVYHKDTIPPHVSYEGDSSAFSIKTDSDTEVEVGSSGSRVFKDDEVVINSTNNTIVFKEDNGHGTASERTMTAVVPDGEYTPEKLETLVRNALNQASGESGYGVTYDVNYDADEEKFSIQSDGSYSGYVRTAFLWDTGDEPYLNGYNTSSGIDPDDLEIDLKNRSALTIGTPEPAGSDPVKLIWDGEGNWIVENNPGYVMPAKVEGTHYGVDLDLTESGVADISVKLDHPVEKAGDYIEFDIIPEKGDHSIGHEIGFPDNNVITTTPVSDRSAAFVTDIEITAGVNDYIDFKERMSDSIIAAGTVLDADYEITGDTAVSSGTIAAGSVLGSGSTIVSGTTLGAGTVIGSGITLSPDIELARDVTQVSSGTLISGSLLAAGTVLGSGTVLGMGTTIGSGTVVGSGTVLTADVILGAAVAGADGGTMTSGSVLTSGTVLGAGTVIASGTTIGSGTLLTGDFLVDSDITAAMGGVLSANSFVASGSTLVSGTVLASDESISIAASGVSGTVTGDGTSTLAQLAMGSPPLGAAGSYTVVSGGDTLSHGITTLASGSILAFGTSSGLVAAGSSFTGTSVTTASGSALDTAMTLQGGDMGLTADTTVMAGTTLASGTTLSSGSVVDNKGITNSDAVVTLNGNMTLKGTTTLNGAAANNELTGNVALRAGTTLGAGSTLISGSSVDNQAVTINNGIVLTSDMAVTGSTGVSPGTDMTVLPGTVIAKDSILEQGSVVNSDLPIDADQTIAAGTVFPADFGITSDITVTSGVLASGTLFEAGSVIRAGTVLGAGSVIGAGETLTSDVQAASDIRIINSGTLNVGSFLSSGSTLVSGTVLGIGEQIDFVTSGGASGTLSGNGVLTLGELASGTAMDGAGVFMVNGDDTLSHGITTLASGSTLSFGTGSGVITSGSVLAGSEITISSGTTLNGDMNLVKDGVELGTTISGPPGSLIPGTTLTAGSIIGKGSQINNTMVTTGGVSAELTARITAGTYSDMDALAEEIETQLEKESANNIDYAVSYDGETSRFNIRENGSTLDGFDMLWKTGSHAGTSVGDILGFYTIDDTVEYPESDNAPVRSAITIDDSNDILDFEEIDGSGTASGTLSAFISHGTYTSMDDLTSEIESSMEAVSAGTIDYDVSYDNAGTPPGFVIQGNAGGGNELLLFNDRPVNSIGDTLGFETAKSGYTGYKSDEAPALITFGSDNNAVDFAETGVDGVVSDPVSFDIPEGPYTSLDDVAQSMEAGLKQASPNNVVYEVAYDYGEGKFTVKGSSEAITSFSLLWHSGENGDKSAASLLGFDINSDDVMVFSESDEDIVNINIDTTNNKIDFQEITADEEGNEHTINLTASVESGNYTSHNDLASAVENAMEKRSLEKGNRIDYSVSYDGYTKKFTIKEAGTELDGFGLTWGTGDNRPVLEGGTGETIGEILGFDAYDDMDTPVESSETVEWSIFNTLLDFKTHLEENDPDGIERILNRLETHFDKTTSHIVNTGMRYSRLDVRERLTTEVNLSLTERRSMIEDADLIKAVMDLKAVENAYKASLSSTSKVINISLVDYLR
ncbi:MAG: flagellar hook-associated protein FlgL [Thermodesulfobacteriota bacterium]|nr:flagellar hook-associated protein FlgL [Thermodesulfobacteriota bacterium]